MSELEIYKGMAKKMKDDEIKKEILMMYELADDNDLKYYEAIQRIIDYITNLQQENEVLENEKDMFYKVSQERLNKWLSLNDENNKLVEIIKNYKSRCEKAVEYMNNIFNITGVKDMFDIMNKLEDILNGRVMNNE